MKCQNITHSIGFVLHIIACKSVGLSLIIAISINQYFLPIDTVSIHNVEISIC